VSDVTPIIDQARSIETAPAPAQSAADARRSLRHELISGTSGLLLALFMWGHMVFVASILLGHQSFDRVADAMEQFYVAQPTVVLIFVLFLIHAAFAARKIPAQLRERRRFRRVAEQLRESAGGWPRSALPHHVESSLWLWQVRTGLVLLVLGSFHLVLMMLDIFTPLFGDRVGIEAVSTLARTGAGLVWLYAPLLVCVEFHAGVGLYRLAVKWGFGARLSRRTLHRFEQVVLWFFLGLGAVVLVVLAGWLDPPLAFLLGA